MNYLFLICLYCARAILSLRYKVEIREINPAAFHQLKRGTLFLPNHAALVDPLIIFIWLCPTF